jgi:copper(I)-binding protein
MRKIILTMLLPLAATVAQADGLEKSVSGLSVDGAWVREVPPVSASSVLFLHIHNGGKKAVTLTSIDTPVAAAAELHVMSMAGGLMRMDRLKSATIPAGGDLTLDPSEKHIMLIGLKVPLKQGQQVPLTLHFRNGAVVTTTAIVKADPE